MQTKTGDALKGESEDATGIEKQTWILSKKKKD